MDCSAPTTSDSADHEEMVLGEAAPQGQLLTSGKTQSQTPVQRPATLRNTLSRNGRHGRYRSSPRSSVLLPRSNGDGHGFTASTNDDKESRNLAEEADEREKFEVKWDACIDDPSLVLRTTHRIVSGRRTVGAM
ncbi:MAG: hypothetical protein Q9195_000048 [Heterodermia aff. obscurata]